MMLGGSNPAGTSTTSLNYIGDYAYAYSGQQISGAGTTTTLLDFTISANNYVVGTFQFGFNNKFNDDEQIAMYIDSQLVASMVFNNTFERAELNDFKVILPPSSHIKVQIIKLSGSADVATFAWFQGRVYQ